MASSIIRLFVEQSLGSGQDVTLTREAAHYLFSVMRRKIGDVLHVFNGRDGEWRVSVVSVAKKSGVLRIEAQVRAQTFSPDLTLYFSPVKRSRTDFIVEKAVELGVRRLCPVFTDHTNSERIRVDRMAVQSREAAEQSERLDLPEIAEPQRLSQVLDQWDSTRRLFYGSERAKVASPLAALDYAGPAAILIGPEGGFSSREIERLDGMDVAVAISLGPRILRADTAVVAALTLWQASNGDWR